MGKRKISTTNHEARTVVSELIQEYSIKVNKLNAEALKGDPDNLTSLVLKAVETVTAGPFNDGEYRESGELLRSLDYARAQVKLYQKRMKAEVILSALYNLEWKDLLKGSDG